MFDEKSKLLVLNLTTYNTVEYAPKDFIETFKDVDLNKYVILKITEGYKKSHLYKAVIDLDINYSEDYLTEIMRIWFNYENTNEGEE